MDDIEPSSGPVAAPQARRTRRNAAEGSEADHDTGLFGLVRFGGLITATPIADIREVVPCPARLDPFPASHPHVLGAIALRGQVIPVLDMAALLAVAGHGGDTVATPEEAMAIVVILRHGGRVIGALANAIDGVAGLTEDALLPLAHADGSPGPVLAGFAHNGLHGVLLDIAWIATLPGILLAEDRVGQTRQNQDLVPTLLFRAGGVGYAIPAHCVDASVPWQALGAAPSPDPLWTAMLPYNGVEIPAIDTLVLLGQGALPEGRKGSEAIVVRTAQSGAGGRDGPGLVALLIDAVDTIARLSPECGGVLDPRHRPADALICGMVPDPTGPRLMIDAARLVRDPRLAVLGRIEQRSQTHGSPVAGRLRHPAADAAKFGGDVRPFLVFTAAGAPFAAQLEDVEAIVPIEQDIVALPDDGAGLRGLLLHRREAIPLYDLACRLSLPPAEQPPRFIVIARGAPSRARRGGGNGEAATCGRAGFAVENLQSVERVVLQRIGPAEGRTAPAPGGIPDATIRLRSGQACRVLDLAGLGAPG